MSTDKIRQFGEEFPGRPQVLRLGGYGVFRNDQGRIAMVLTPGGFFLPGGAQEKDESPEAAFVRETAEECGLSVRVTGHIGVADELVYAEDEQTYFRKRCAFFTAEVKTLVRPIEPDHKLVWLSPKEALSQLTHESQRWALRRYLGESFGTRVPAGAES